MAIYIHANVVSVNEEAGTATVTATLSEASSGTVSFTYVVGTGSATSLDVSSPSGTLTFAPGQTSRSFTTSVFDDALAEPAETFVIIFSAAVGAVLTAPRLVGVIGASDSAAGGTGYISVDPVVVDASRGVAQLRVSRDSSLGMASLDYVTQPGTALAGSDYTAVSGSLTFAPGETEKTVDIPIATGPLVEPTEWFTVALDNVVGALPGRSSALVTIAGHGPASSGLPTIWASPVELNEAFPFGVLGLYLSEPSSSEVGVTVALQSTSALTGSFLDVVTTASTRFVFPPGTTYLPYPIAVRPDALTEGLESLVVQLSSPTNAVIGTPVVPVNIASEQTFAGGVFVAVGDVDGDEGSDVVWFTARLNQRSPNPVTVHYSTVIGTADEADFVPTSGVITFAPFENQVRVPVRLLDDSALETVATFGLQLSDPMGATLADGFGQFTLFDNDGPGVASPWFDDPWVLVDPVTGAMDIVLRQQGPLPQAASVLLSVTPSGPAQNQLVTGFFNVGIAAGSVVNTLTLPVNPNPAAEQAKGVVLSFGGGTGPMAVAMMAPHGGYLPTFEDRGVIRVADVWTEEADGVVRLRFVYDGPDLATVIRPSVTFTSGSAEIGSDVLVQPFSTELAFGPGLSNVATLTLALVDDALPEGTEQFFWTLEDVPDTIDGPGVGTVTVYDNDQDTQALPVVCLEDVVADPTTGQLALPVRLKAPSDQTVTVTMHDMAAPGSEGAAFWGQMSQLVFLPGEVLAYYRLVLDVLLVAQGWQAIQVFIDAVSNGVAERNTTVAMIAPQGGATDEPPTVTVRGKLKDARGPIRDLLDDWGEFELQLSHASTKVVTVQVSVPSYEAIGTDIYTSPFFGRSTRTVTFEPGQTVRRLDVTSLRPADSDPADYPVQLRLDSAVNATLLQRELSLALLDDVPSALVLPESAQPAHRVAALGAAEASATGDGVVRIDPAVVDESSGYVDVHVWLNAPRSVPVTLTYSTAAANTAGATDFAPVSNGTLRFEAGEVHKTLRFALNDDATSEGAESFQIRLTAGTGLLAASPLTTVVIPASDRSAGGLPLLSVLGSTVNQADGYARVTVALDRASSEAVRFDFRTSDHSARAGSDYTALTGSGGFLPGQTVTTLLVPLLRDATAEGEQAFYLDVSAVQGAAVASGRGVVSIAALPEAADGGPVVSAVGGTFFEDDGWADARVVLSQASSQIVRVTYALVAGSATANDYASGHGGVLVFAPGETVQTVPIGLVDDALAEASESFTLSLSAPSGATLGTTEAVLTILDVDGGPDVTVVSNASGVVGSADITFTLTFSQAVTGLTATPGDIAVHNGTLKSLSGSGSVYSAVVTPAVGVDDAVSLVVLRDAAQNGLGRGNHPGGGVQAVDTRGPMPAASVPVSGATGVARDVAIVITLDEAAQRGSGRILLKTAAGAEAQAFDIAAVGAGLTLSGDGLTLTLVPSEPLAYGMAYRVAFEAGVLLDAGGQPSLADESITFTTVANAAPVAAGLLLQGSEDVALQGSLPAASDAEGHSISYALADPAPTLGQVEVTADGHYTYVPTADAHGADSFGFAVTDAFGGRSTYLVTLTIASVNDAPTAAPGSVATPEDTPLTGQLPAALDVDGDTVTYAAASPAPGKGQVVVQADGRFTYTPGADLNGSDRFGFSVTDPSGARREYTVDVTVGAVNDAPVARAASAEAVEDTVVEERLPAALDADGDTLRYAVVTAPARGTVVVQDDGSYRYTPAADAHGSDSFTYAVFDPSGGTDTQQVTLLIRPVNDAPVGSVSVTGKAEVFERLSVLSGVTDADGLGNFSFQWLRDGSAITGATGNSYLLTHEDVGHAVSVRVSYVDGGGSTEALTSAATAPVAGVTVVRGTAGRDTLGGTALRDDIAAGAGDDLVLASPGNDTISGDEGLDIMSWVGTTAAVTADLHSGLATPAGDAPDILILIEALFGGSAADHFIGLDQAPNLRGETLRGGGGNDTLDGGGGVDTAEYAFARDGYSISRNLATGEITVTDTDLSNGNDGSDTLLGIERVQFADQMLAFGSRAEEIVRVAFVLWSPAIVTSSTLFSRGFSFYDVGYTFQLVSQAALQFWADKSDAQLAAQLVTNSGMSRSPEQLLALAAAAGGGDVGRAAMVREAALDAATTALLEASRVREVGVVSANEVPDFGALFGLLPG